MGAVYNVETMIKGIYIQTSEPLPSVATCPNPLVYRFFSALNLAAKASSSSCSVSFADPPAVEV